MEDFEQQCDQCGKLDSAVLFYTFGIPCLKKDCPHHPAVDHTKMPLPGYYCTDCLKKVDWPQEYIGYMEPSKCAICNKLTYKIKEFAKGGGDIVQNMILLCDECYLDLEINVCSYCKEKSKDLKVFTSQIDFRDLSNQAILLLCSKCHEKLRNKR